jgi:hypothetical protein
MTLFIIYNKYDPKYNILYLCVFLGIITSILNHGIHSTNYKYLDRTIMVLNVFVFIYFIMQINGNEKKIYEFSILFFACFLYLFSKLLEKNSIVKNSLHSFSHFLSVLLLYTLHIYTIEDLNPETEFFNGVNSSMM